MGRSHRHDTTLAQRERPLHPVGGTSSHVVRQMADILKMVEVTKPPRGRGTAVVSAPFVHRATFLVATPLISSYSLYLQHFYILLLRKLYSRPRRGFVTTRNINACSKYETGRAALRASTRMPIAWSAWPSWATGGVAPLSARDYGCNVIRSLWSVFPKPRARLGSAPSRRWNPDSVPSHQSHRLPTPNKPSLHNSYASYKNNNPTTLDSDWVVIPTHKRKGPPDRQNPAGH